MKYALKEWDTTIESLGQGKIIAIWRKGGLNENFTVEQKKFILFPTFNHESKDKIKEYFLSPQTQDFGPNKDNQIKIKYFAEVHETLTVNTFEELLRISSELIHQRQSGCSGDWRRCYERKLRGGLERGRGVRAPLR